MTAGGIAVVVFILAFFVLFAVYIITDIEELIAQCATRDATAATQGKHLIATNERRHR